MKTGDSLCSSRTFCDKLLWGYYVTASGLIPKLCPCIALSYTLGSSILSSFPGKSSMISLVGRLSGTSYGVLDGLFIRGPPSKWFIFYPTYSKGVHSSLPATTIRLWFPIQCDVISSLTKLSWESLELSSPDTLAIIFSVSCVVNFNRYSSISSLLFRFLFIALSIINLSSGFSLSRVFFWDRCVLETPLLTLSD